MYIHESSAKRMKKYFFILFFYYTKTVMILKENWRQKEEIAVATQKSKSIPKWLDLTSLFTFLFSFSLTNSSD